MRLPGTARAPLVRPPEGKRATIFIHGIKGSFLAGPDGRRAWLSLADGFRSGGPALSLAFAGQRPHERFEEPLHPDGPLTRFTLVPYLVEETIYLPFLEAGSRFPGFIPFSYDWRLSASEAVRALSSVVERYEDVTLIGHSLGGLIALSYLRHGGGAASSPPSWAGARRVRRVALIGAPFGGAPSFLGDIIRGDRVGRNAALLSREAVFTFASAYELLPFPMRAGDLDLDDPGTWAERRLGIFEEDPGEAYRAHLAVLLEARRLFRSGLAPEPGPGPDVRALVVTGVGRPTVDRALFRDGRIELEPTASGDDRVPETSTLPPSPLSFERLVTKANHVQLLNDRDVLESLVRLASA